MSNKHIEVNESEKQANPIFNYLSIVLVLVGLGLFYGLKADGWIKWILFVVSLFAGFGVFYFLSPIGINLHKYFKESYREIQKVVWPTRKETTNFTLIVFAFVVILGLFLWAVDSGLAWVLYGVILGRGS
jgi:preprotein translocase subunit SecE